MSNLKRTCLLFVVALVGAAWGAPAKIQAQTPDRFRAELMTVRIAAVSSTPMVLPHDVVLTPDGEYLVVADMGQNRVVFLDASTLALRHVIGEGIMSYPHDVTFDPQGHLLVADSGNDRILSYSLVGLKAQLLDVWNGLNGVEGVAVTPDGNVYAALVGDNSVVRLNDGKIVATVSRALGMPLDRPHDVEVKADKDGVTIIVADAGNHRLIAFDAALNPLFEISTWDPPFSEPKYISVDENGVIYVADQYNNRIRTLDASATPLGQFAMKDVKLPEGVFAKEGRIWVSDTEGGRILLYQQGDNN